MQISDLTLQDIEGVSFLYQYILWGTKKDPTDMKPKQQKKVRKKLEISIRRKKITVDPKVLTILHDEWNDAEFFHFLKMCHQEDIRLERQAEKEFNRCCTMFSEPVQKAFHLLIDQQFLYSPPQLIGTDAILEIDHADFFNCQLRLCNATGMPDIDTSEYLMFDHSMLQHQNHSFVLQGYIESFETDTVRPFSIRFTDAKAKYNVFQIQSDFPNRTPWDVLSELAQHCMQKYALSPTFCNEQEIALLPLLAEILQLTAPYVLPIEYHSSSYQTLKTLSNKHGFSGLLSKWEAIEQYAKSNKKRKLQRYQHQLLAKLNTDTFEPLWREIYQSFSASQSCYPAETERCCDPDFLHQIRTKIQQLVTSHGYTGSYPDFIKCDRTQGFHIAVGYDDQTYLVRNQTKAAFHIHCTETCMDNVLYVTFCCGTELLKKGQQPGDIYSCLFHTKGQRYFRCVSLGALTPDSKNVLQTLNTYAQIAVKKAEWKRLTRMELAEYPHPRTSPWYILFLAFLGGGLFTLSFWPLLLLFCMLITQDSLLNIWESLKNSFVWLITFTWVGFGGSMGVIFALGNHK